MKKVFLTAIPSLVMICVIAFFFNVYAIAPSQEPDPKQDAEAQAWAKLEEMDAASLEQFLKEFPEGQHAGEAKLYLSLHNKMAAIRAKKAKPSFVIPFEKLGQRWEGWKQRRPEKSAVGVYCNGSTIGIFAALGCMTISMDWSSMPITPTGDGSVLAIKTYGVKFSYINSIVFQTAGGEEPMYFGVVHGVGLVHLHGKGKVIMPDGKEYQLL